LALTIGAAAALLASASARAQEAPQSQDSATPSVENSKFQALGEVNANAVFVRSGPSENDYPVMKLDKGAHVTVVGARFEWLKIIPPDGSFCYVAKAYVEKHGDGSAGRVTNTLNVRVGSTLNAMKTKLAMKLEAGSTVQILGDQDEYFRIKPPEGVFVYVNKQFVDAVKVLASNDAQPPATQPEVAQARPDEKTETAENTGGSSGESWATPTPPSVTNTPATQPANTAVAENTPPNNTSAAPATEPTSQPSMAQAEADFDQLEIAYGEMLKQPLDQQDIPGMMSSYQKMSASNQLPESLRRVAEAKVRFLTNREKDRQEFLAVKKQQDDARQRQQALLAEREEIQQRLREREVKYYTAVGTLRPSSVQSGTTTLYRLTDPANGRTVVYIRTNDSKLGGMIGQFIGVRGDVATDQQLALRVVAPTLIEPVDQSKLYTNVASQIVPPSLMPGGAGTATTGNE
jgi:SH3-like domain-containing protein/flagellar motor protein MotB